MSHRDLKKSFVVLLVGLWGSGLLGLGSVAEASSSEKYCDGYDRKQRIGRLGGRTAFSKTPVTSPADLAAQLDEHRSEIEAIMAEKGFGHLTEALYKAVHSGEGLSERDLVRGEVFDWMTFRKRKGPETYGPMCFNARKAYDAFVIEVKEEKPHPATAKCSLTATGGACVENEIKVNAAGSSKGVEVTMSGPGGSQKIISAGKTSWSGLPSAAGTYTFTAKASATGSKTVTTHTFVIPKACLNLAYTGSETEEMEGAVDSCEQKATVKVDECKPHCALEVSPTEVQRKENVTIDVSGKWDSGGIKVDVTDPKGNVTTLTDFPATMTPRKRGVYQVMGTATNSAGEASCKSQFEVVKPESAWTARFFGLKLNPDDESIFASSLRPNGVSERTKVALDGGEGGGVGLEYHFNPRVGLEGSVLFAQLGSKFILDLDNDWEQDEDDSSFLAFVIGPNFHLTPDKRVDFYIGPFIGIVDIDDATYNALGETHRRSFDADTVIGLQLGLDIPFGDAGWAFHLGGRYMDLSVEVDNGPEIGADPLLFEAGFAYKF
ncbi:MAG: outer membrane beta-barrel protein [Acidobacteriota bacterium]